MPRGLTVPGPEGRGPPWPSRAPKVPAAHERPRDAAGGRARGPRRGPSTRERARRERADRRGGGGRRRTVRGTDRGGRPGLRGARDARPGRAVRAPRPHRRPYAHRVKPRHPAGVRPRGRAPRHDDRGLRPPRDRQRARPRGYPLHAGRQRGAAAHDLRDGELVRAGDPHGHGGSRARRGGPRLARPPAGVGPRGGS